MNYGGYLTLQAGSPKITGDQIGQSTLWYCPDKSGLLTVGGTDISFLSGPTDQNGWSASLARLAVGQYHVFGSPSGLVIGAAWGSASPEILLTRNNGQLVDPATGNVWLGSINVGVAGQLTCHASEGATRRWDVYNAHNRKPIILDLITVEKNQEYCPTNQYPAWEPFNNDAANCATLMLGGPEVVEVEYIQQAFLNSTAGAYGILNAVGWNGVVSGKWGGGTQDAAYFAGGMNDFARFCAPAAVGVNMATMMVSAAVNSSSRASELESAAQAPVWNYNADANVLLTLRTRG